MFSIILSIQLHILHKINLLLPARLPAGLNYLCENSGQDTDAKFCDIWILDSKVNVIETRVKVIL